MDIVAPGLAIDVVFDTGRVGRSFLQDVDGDRLVLLQTSPPLDMHYLHRHIRITFLDRDKGLSRYGFWAEIVELREGYVTRGRGFPAIIARKMTEIVPCELRVHQRIRPGPSLQVRLAAESLEVVNISQGGAQLVRGPGRMPPISPEDIIILTVERGDALVFRSSRVIRLWHTKGSSGPQHFAVKFLRELPPSLIVK